MIFAVFVEVVSFSSSETLALYGSASLSTATRSISLLVGRCMPACRAKLSILGKPGKRAHCSQARNEVRCNSVD